MSKNFRLSSDITELEPEPFTFTDNGFGGDGTTYDVLTWEHMGPRQIAPLRRLERRWIANTAILAHDASAEEELERAGEQLEADTNTFLCMVVPSMPTERWPHIPFKWRQDFVDWWLAEQPKPPSKTPKAKAPQRRTARGKSSQKSAPPTA